MTDLGRSAADMSDDEIAYLCARHMEANGERDPLITGGTVYRNGVGHVTSALFGYEAIDEKRMARIRGRLHANGIRVWRGEGGTFNGWIIPDMLVWSSEEPSTVAVGASEKPVETPVAHKWYCRLGCGRNLEFVTEEGRDGHEKAIHETKEVAVEAAEATVQEAAEVVPVAKKRRSRIKLTPEAKKTLAAIQAKPGLHPHDYALMIGEPVSLQPLKTHKLIKVENKRYFPTSLARPAHMYGDKKGHTYHNQTREDLLAAVKANPGSTAMEVSVASGRNYTSTIKELYDLVAMKKVRTTGRPRMRAGSPEQLRFYPVNVMRPHRSPVKKNAEVTTSVVVVVKGDAVAKLTAIVNENKTLREENARLKAELASFAKVKELLEEVES